MGLDMYLNASKHTNKINWQAVQANEALNYESPEAILPDWKKIIEASDMGGVAVDVYGVDVEVTCAYWRKCNQIHNWFVQNVQGGEDNCRSYYVRTEQIKELLSTCKEALKKKDPSLLPPAEGFFFGGTDIDEWYWGSIKQTITKLERVLALPEVDELSFSYQSSW